MEETKIWGTKEVPYENLSQVKEAIKKREVSINIAMDIARKWIFDGIYAPTIPKIIVWILSYAIFGFLIFLLIYPFILHKYLYLLFIIPAILFFFLMNPIAKNMNKGCATFFTFAGFGLFIYYFFTHNQIFFLIFSLTILVPWFIWELITVISVESATKTALNNEDLFIDFIKNGVLVLRPLANQSALADSDNEIISVLCPKCGKEVSTSAKFCKHCGETLRKV